MNVAIKPSTVNLIAKLLHVLAESGTIGVPEEHEIVAQLRSLSREGVPLPVIVPKLIDQSEAAAMLGIGLSNFKKLEHENAFPFKRKLVGTSVRYRNTDVIKYLLSE